MIDFCLKNTDETVIKNTIENLKMPLLPIFLNVLMNKIINYPNKSKNLIKWLKFLLTIHTSFFIGCLDLKEKFGNLQTVLLNKTRNFNKLNELKKKIGCLKAFELGKYGENGEICEKRKKIHRNDDNLKPLLIIEEGDLEKNEEIINEITEEKNDYLDVSIEEGDTKEEEFDKALRAQIDEDMEKGDEDFIGFG